MATKAAAEAESAQGGVNAIYAEHYAMVKQMLAMATVLRNTGEAEAAADMKMQADAMLAALES